MELRINKLTVDNFKGIRHFDLDLAGRSVEILGDNGTGKSTIFDAFTWLLFGKDHRGQSASGTSGFDITPIDPVTREEIHRADTTVEAELTLDGAVKTLRRIWKEDWVKPRGEAEAVLAGHSGKFFVDGVECPTKKEYDDIIKTIVAEDIFRAITDPLYLIGNAHWKELRNILLSIADNDIDRDGLRSQFADLIAEMNGEPMEKFRKRIAAAKKKLRQDLDAVDPTIRGMMKSRPEPEDYNALRRQLEVIQEEVKAGCAPIEKKIAEIDTRLQGAKAAAEADQERLSELYRRQMNIRMEQENLLSAARQGAATENSRRAMAIQECQTRLSEARAALSRHDADADIDGRKRRMARMRDEVKERSEKVVALGDTYRAEKEKAMELNVDTHCPACGQELPAETIEEARRMAREAWIASRKDRLQKIIDDARRLKEQNAAAVALVEQEERQIAEWNERRTAKQQAVESAEVALSGVIATPTVNSSAEEEKCRKSPEFAKLRSAEQEVNAAILEMKANDNGEADNARLLTERRALEKEVRSVIDAGYARMAEIKGRMAMEAEIQRIDTAIAKERENARIWADELARLERLEFRAEEYVRADIGAIEDVVNNKFRHARFRMFDRTQEGGMVETCYVTDAKGVPYRSMNDAQRIICGLDVIRVISERYGSYAPIFIDNAESITTRDFGTDSQVVALTVTAGAGSLTIKQ